MYQFQYPNFPHTKWDDIVPGIDGAEGWYSDDLHPGKRVIFFLGAWGYRDALSCMSATMEEPSWFPGIGIHSGFLRLANRAWDAIQEAVTLEKPIVFAGHSMGGALATICMIRYWQSTGIKPGLELYAAASIVGNRGFAGLVKALKPDLTNHCVGADVVPRLHLLGWILGYRKPWKTVKHKSPNPGRWWNRIFLDHLPVSYIKAIKTQ